jgi:hypothetical protein
MNAVRRIRGLLCVLALLVAFTLVASGCNAGMDTPSEAESDAASATVSSAADVSSALESVPPSSSEEPVPEVSDDPNVEGFMKNSIFIYGDTALEVFGGTEATAKNYAQAISSAKKALGDGVTVYNLVAPTHVEFALPPRYRSVSGDERANLDAIYANYSAEIRNVDVYDILSRKRNEYIYFNTDHHWTGLGAYYAYTEFAKAAGFTPLDKDTLTMKSIPGLLGSLYDATGVQAVKDNIDHVDYFVIPGDYECMVYNKGSTQPTETVLLHEYAQGKYAYGVFLGGDKPLFTVKNKGQSDGRKIAVVKESFGNAFAPFLAPHYEEVHIVDARYFQQNLPQYVKEHGITEVLFINNIVAANAGVRVQELNGLFD